MEMWVGIDIETEGLEEHHRVLQVGLALINPDTLEIVDSCEVFIPQSNAEFSPVHSEEWVAKYKEFMVDFLAGGYPHNVTTEMFFIQVKSWHGLYGKLIPFGRQVRMFDIPKSVRLLPTDAVQGEFLRFFHHRTVDMSTIGQCLQHLNPLFPRRAKGEDQIAHTALQDLRDDLETLRLWKEMLRQVTHKPGNATGKIVVEIALNEDGKDFVEGFKDKELFTGEISHHMQWHCLPELDLDFGRVSSVTARLVAGTGHG